MKHTNLRWMVSAAFFCCVALLDAPTVFGGIITVDETAGGFNFGNLKQTDTTACSGIDGTQACGPTAAVNSFVFLQNRYPGIYDNSLIQNGPAIIPFSQAYSNLITTANVLGGAQFMNCTCDGGTGISNFITGKMNYINQQVGAGKTVFPFETVFNLTPSDTTLPNFGFLLSELLTNEDVELLVSYHDANGFKNPTNGKFYGGHYVTMTGLTLNDANNNGKFDPGEALTLNFIDPGTGLPGTANGLLDPFGFDTTYGAGGVITGASISGIVAESPVPEPGTLILLFSGLVGLGLLQRRRVRRYSVRHA
jgi:hypothetical protein